MEKLFRTEAKLNMVVTSREQEITFLFLLVVIR